MNHQEICNVQLRIGAVADGFWGPKSTAACKSYLRSMMPIRNPWPNQDQESLAKFYGKPGDESQLTLLDVSDICICYDDEPLDVIRCHHKVADSLKRILVAIHRSPWRYVLADYAGVFNNRPMRGGSLPSLHARGAAIDLRPETNGNRAHWPAQSDMPIQIMEFFAVEGWLSAGAFWSRDAMHFEATS